MKKYLSKKEFTKPMFIFVISLVFITFIMFGMLSTLKLGIYSSIVNGSSMEKTLSDKTKILFVKANLIPIKRGDIVSVDAYDSVLGNFHYIKRVIGLPNEEISIKGSKVYINGNLLEEPYAYYSKESSDNFVFQLNDDEYFIMGDNRCDSEDSRYIGAIKEERILSLVFKYNKD